MNKDEDCEIYSIEYFEWTITDDQLAINLDHEGARKFPGRLESKHSMEYNGEIFTVPPGDEWLVLD